MAFRTRRHSRTGDKEKQGGLHCLVPSRINHTQSSVGKIPFVIPFVLQANSLISLPVPPAHECVSLSFSHLSVKVSIDHYLGPLLYSYKWAPLHSNQHRWSEMSSVTAHHRGGRGGRGALHLLRANTVQELWRIFGVRVIFLSAKRDPAWPRVKCAKEKQIILKYSNRRSGPKQLTRA